MKTSQKAYTAALVNAFIIGFSFMFVKIALDTASPMDTLAHRFTISFLGASIILLFTGAKFPVQMKDILRILPLALLYPTLFFTFQTYGLVYTSSSEAGIIFATIPILTMILATFFLDERSSRGQTFFICLSVSGVIYIFVINGFQVEVSNLAGIILILLSALSSASYNVFARKLTQKYSLFPITYIMVTIGFISFNSMALLQHTMTGSLSTFLAPLSNLSFIVSIFYLGVLSTLCTSYLSNYALSKIEASKVSVFSNLATLITLFAGVIILHEDIRYYHVIGATVILIGLIGTNFSGKKKKQTVNEEAVKVDEIVPQKPLGL